MIAPYIFQTILIAAVARSSTTLQWEMQGVVNSFLSVISWTLTSWKLPHCVCWDSIDDECILLAAASIIHYM